MPKPAKSAPVATTSTTDLGLPSDFAGNSVIAQVFSLADARALPEAVEGDELRRVQCAPGSIATFRTVDDRAMYVAQRGDQLVAVPFTKPELADLE